MKKVMFLIVGLLFSVSASAATLSLSTAGSTNATQGISVINNGPVAIGQGIANAGNWQSLFKVTTDVDTGAKVKWSFNPDNVTSATLRIYNETDGVSLFNQVVSTDFSIGVLLLTAKTYLVDFLAVNSTGASSYDVSVPAALLLFAPALLGFFGLRRKAAVAV